MARALKGGKNCNRFPFFLLFLSASPSLRRAFSFIYFLPIDLGHPFVDHTSRYWSACPSSTCCELRQTRWYYSGVIPPLMWLDCQLQAFNAEVTASPRIATPPRPYNCPTVLVLLFGTTRRGDFEGVLLSPSVTLVGQGQDGPWRCLPRSEERRVGKECLE